MSKSISELDRMTRCSRPPVDLERADRLAIVAFCGLAVQDRKQSRHRWEHHLSEWEIGDRRSFVTSLTRLGLKEENTIGIGGHLWGFLVDGVRLTLRVRAETQTHVWKVPASILKGFLMTE